MANTSIFPSSCISGATRVDAATKSFTLAACAHLPKELASASWRIVLPEDALEDWKILNAEEERSLHNSMLTQAWARECLEWLQSGKVNVCFAPVSMESMVFYDGDSISGGLIGSCSFNAKGFGLLPNVGGFSGCVPMLPEQCQSITGLFDGVWNAADFVSVIGGGDWTSCRRPTLPHGYIIKPVTNC